MKKSPLHQQITDPRELGNVSSAQKPSTEAFKTLKEIKPASQAQQKSNIPDYFGDIAKAMKPSEDQQYHSYGKPDTLIHAATGTKKSTEHDDEGRYGKINVMPPLKPIVEDEEGEQFYLQD